MQKYTLGVDLSLTTTTKPKDLIRTLASFFIAKRIPNDLLQKVIDYVQSAGIIDVKYYRDIHKDFYPKCERILSMFNIFEQLISDQSVNKILRRYLDYTLMYITDYGATRFTVQRKGFNSYDYSTKCKLFSLIVYNIGIHILFKYVITNYDSIQSFFE